MFLRSLLFAQVLVLLHLSLSLIWPGFALSAMIDWLFLEGALFLVLGGMFDFASSMQVRNFEALWYRTPSWSFQHYQKQGRWATRFTGMGILLLVEVGIFILVSVVAK